MVVWYVCNASSLSDLNQQPADYKSAALPIEPRKRKKADYSPRLLWVMFNKVSCALVSTDAKLQWYANIPEQGLVVPLDAVPAYKGLAFWGSVGGDRIKHDKVTVGRLELPTPWLKVRCSTDWATQSIQKNSCGKGIRTPDLQVMGLTSCLTALSRDIVLVKIKSNSCASICQVEFLVQGWWTISSACYLYSAWWVISWYRLSRILSQLF